MLLALSARCQFAYQQTYLIQNEKETKWRKVMGLYDTGVRKIYSHYKFASLSSFAKLSRIFQQKKQLLNVTNVSTFNLAEICDNASKHCIFQQRRISQHHHSCQGSKYAKYFKGHWGPWYQTTEGPHNILCEIWFL